MLLGRQGRTANSVLPCCWLLKIIKSVVFFLNLTLFYYPHNGQICLLSNLNLFFRFLGTCFMVAELTWYLLLPLTCTEIEVQVYNQITLQRCSCLPIEREVEKVDVVLQTRR